MPASDFHIMTKPIGPICNLDCKYCFYLEKENLYPNTRSGTWQESWKRVERDAQGRSPAFMSSAFIYDAERDIYLCPAGEKLTHHAVSSAKNEFGCQEDVKN